jgi:putative spermidine/putrescine transport system permease protein
VNRSRASTWALAVYFVLFIAVMYLPMILMAILSLQGDRGGLTFPMQGFSGHWWQSLFDDDIPTSHATEIRDAALTSLYLAFAVGVVTSFFSLTLSMAFRRRFRADGVLFYLIILGLMTPGYLLSLGTSLFWQTLDKVPGTWITALGTNSIWAIPFGFLTMVAVWNRYDVRVEEAARDLGASTRRTFREVTLPLIWTGLFGAFLFGFVLSWNEYDRTALVLTSGQLTLPIQIFALTTGSVIRPDLYALGTATTIFILVVVALVLVLATIYVRRRGVARVPLEAQVAEELGEVEGLEIELPPDAASGGARAG